MKINKLLKNSIIYGVINVLQKGILFFLLPLYTAYLSPSDYGVLSVIVSVSSFISIFIILGLDGAATRFYYKNKDLDYAKYLWGSITTFILISSLLVGGSFILLHKLILDPFMGEIDFYPFVFLGIINAILSPLYLFFQTYLQTKQDGVYYGINSISYFALQITLIVVFLTIFELGIIGILLANVCTSLAFFIYVIIAYFPKIKFGLKCYILQPAFKYSFPLVPHSLAAWSTGMIDKLFLNDISGKAETGLYSVAQQFGALVGVAGTSINKAYAPWFFEKESQGENGIKQITMTGEMITIAICFVSLLVSLFSREILQIMVAESFNGVWIIIPLLAFSNAFQTLYYLFVNIVFLENTNLVFIITVTSAAINVVLNIIFIPLWGMYGAAMACFLSILSRSLMAFFISRRINKFIRFNAFKLYAIIFFFFTASLAIFILPDISLIYILAIKLALVIFSGLLIYIHYKNNIHVLIKQVLSN